jgi:hypothetical protein
LEANYRLIPVKPVLTGSPFLDGNHQVDSGGDATTRLGSIPGPTGRVSSRPCTSRLPALSSILLRRSSIPVQSYDFRTGLCSADLSLFQSIVKAFVAPLHALDDWLLRNASKDILKTQMKLLIKNVKLAGWIMNEEKSDLTHSQDLIFIGIRFCTRVGLMFPPPDMIVKILSRVRQGNF